MIVISVFHVRLGYTISSFIAWFDLFLFEELFLFGQLVIFNHFCTLVWDRTVLLSHFINECSTLFKSTSPRHVIHECERVWNIYQLHCWSIDYSFLMHCGIEKGPRQQYLPHFCPTLHQKGIINGSRVKLIGRWLYVILPWNGKNKWIKVQEFVRKAAHFPHLWIMCWKARLWKHIIALWIELLDPMGNKLYSQHLFWHG